jgi:ABC-2 type transport system ATP-binding protein
VGYLVEVPYSYPELTVRENIEIIRRLRFLPERSAVDAIIDKLQLTQYAERKAKNLSQGNAQRLGLAKALIHNPQILILDEPSNALDPAGIVEIRELLLDMANNQGVTVFISSHILGEISKIATRIGIIHDGRLIQEMDTDKIDQYLEKQLVLGAADKNTVIAVLTGKGYTVNSNHNGALVIKDPDAISHPEKIATIMVNAGAPPTLLKVEVEDLESYFLRTIGMKGGIE